MKTIIHAVLISMMLPVMSCAAPKTLELADLRPDEVIEVTPPAALMPPLPEPKTPPTLTSTRVLPFSVSPLISRMTGSRQETEAQMEHEASLR